MSKNMDEQPILIVGAGPTGLTLALFLTHYGIPVRIIDQSQFASQNSRAMIVHARTLEFYEQLGFAQKAIARGIKVASIRLHRGSRILASILIGNVGEGISRFPFLLCFPQDGHEELLIEQLSEKGITVERETKLIHAENKGHCVEAHLETKNGVETFQTPFLCGCDGASSATRHAINMEFEGDTYRQLFYVADVLTEGGTQLGSVDLCMEEADFCAVLPVRQNGTERLIGIIPPDKAEQEHFSLDDVRPIAQQYLGFNIKQVNWFSTYHVHHRVAKHFQQDRIFLLGDAAHIHSPAGGQGMNTGIGDAMNLAWKLAAVVKRQADKKLLETYESERQAFARILVKTTDRAFQLMTDPSWRGRLWRRAIIPVFMPLLMRLSAVRRFAFGALSQTRIHYRHSALSVGSIGQGAKRLQAGDRLPWIQQPHDNYVSLESLRWQIHIYGEVQPGFSEAAAQRGLIVHVFPWNTACENAKFLRNALYLIRPDGHIGLIHSKQNFKVLDRYAEEFKLIFS